MIITPTYLFGTGLANNANTITANISTGKAGGQSAIGGTAASENLTLSSTAHATKGKILFGSSGYNESTNQLGIGTSTPAFFTEFRCSDATGSTTASTVTVSNTSTSGTGVFAGFRVKIGAGSDGGSMIGSRYVLNTYGHANGLTLKIGGTGQDVGITTSDASLSGAATGVDFLFRNNGSAIWKSYGSGTFTGTPAFTLAVDSSGNIIETSGGGGTPALTQYRIAVGDASNLMSSYSTLIYNAGLYVTNVAATTANNGTVNIGSGGFAGGGVNFAGSGNGTSLVVYERTGFGGDYMNIGGYDTLGMIFDNNASLGLNIRPSGADTHSNRLLHIRQGTACGVKLQTSGATFEVWVQGSVGFGLFDITNAVDRFMVLNNGHFQINSNTDLGSIFGINGLPTSNAGLSAGGVYRASAATILANGDDVLGIKV